LIKVAIAVYSPEGSTRNGDLLARAVLGKIIQALQRSGHEEREILKHPLERMLGRERMPLSMIANTQPA